MLIEKLADGCKITVEGIDGYIITKDIRYMLSNIDEISGDDDSIKIIMGQLVEGSKRGGFALLALPRVLEKSKEIKKALIKGNAEVVKVSGVPEDYYFLKSRTYKVVPMSVIERLY
jgi:hypothetical protein